MTSHFPFRWKDKTYRIPDILTLDSYERWSPIVNRLILKSGVELDPVAIAKAREGKPEQFQREESKVTIQLLLALGANPTEYRELVCSMMVDDEGQPFPLSEIGQVPFPVCDEVLTDFFFGAGSLKRGIQISSKGVPAYSTKGFRRLITSVRHWLSRMGTTPSDKPTSASSSTGS